MADNINANRALKAVEEGAAYTKMEYSWSDAFDPKNDRGLWGKVVNDVDRVVPMELRMELAKLLGPHLQPQPDGLLKCRSTLGRIAENMAALRHHIDPLLAHTMEITTPGQFQGADMQESDVIKSTGAIGQILQIEKMIYAGKMWSYNRFKTNLDSVDEVRFNNRRLPHEQQLDETIVARVIKQSGTVVGYHILELVYGKNNETVKILRVGAAPGLAQAGVHTAVVTDILNQINRRFAFDPILDNCLSDETTMLKIE